MSTCRSVPAYLVSLDGRGRPKARLEALGPVVPELRPGLTGSQERMRGVASTPVVRRLRC